MGALLSAPDETIVQILVFMPGKDIQRCRRVCRHLHELVDSTAQLQYLIELGHLGYVEPVRPRSDLTYDQKAKLLREHRLRGASPSRTFTLDTTLPSKLGDTEAQTYAALCDGVYVEGFGSRPHGLIRHLKLYQLPSWNRGTELKKWALQLGMEAAHVDLNFDLNLLCLVEDQNARFDGVLNAAFKVHLCALDSGGAHPGAALPKLSWGENQEIFSNDFGWDMSSHIVGNLLGILFSHEGSRINYLIVWDWPSGSKLLHLRNTGHTPGSFTIIYGKFVVNHRPAVRDYRADPSIGYLDVYRLDRLDERPSPMVTLSLPLPHHYSDHRSSPFRASPPSSTPFDRIGIVSWYRPHPKLYEVGSDADHLCLIQFSFRSGTSGWLVIPSSTIYKIVMDCVANGLSDMTTISWESWGRQTSWVHVFEISSSPPLSTFSSGLRTIVGALTLTGDHTIIWDFNPHAIQSRGYSTGPEHEAVLQVCFPKGVGPEAWGRRDSKARSPTVFDSMFFGDGNLANQPFCVSSLTGEKDSVTRTMMQGEHSTYNQRKAG
ncbi:hypothetical protein FRC12_006713 [Ceratobasidium sp. 428]|nr:hypothetical protein FRC12_006713 [Ceratobasidium sp. 428]